jgi:hypothetical protein
MEGGMVRLEDQRILDLVENALSEWQCDGYVVWKKRPTKWLEANIEGHTAKSVAKLMYEHVRGGGKVDQTLERRLEYASAYEFHYDFRFPIDGRRIYIETVLDETKTGPTITVVNMHDE